MAKPAAAQSISASPPPKPSSEPALKQRKYSPTIETATQNQIFRSVFFPRNMEKIGTRMTYIAVMKLAFAVVVVAIPVC